MSFRFLDLIMADDEAVALAATVIPLADFPRRLTEGEAVKLLWALSFVPTYPPESNRRAAHCRITGDALPKGDGHAFTFFYGRSSTTVYFSPPWASSVWEARYWLATKAKEVRRVRAEALTAARRSDAGRLLVVLVGPSGSGKTTLAMALHGLGAAVFDVYPGWASDDPRTEAFIASILGGTVLAVRRGEPPEIAQEELWGGRLVPVVHLPPRADPEGAAADARMTAERIVAHLLDHPAADANGSST